MHHEYDPAEAFYFSHPQQGRIDFNTVNPCLPRGMDIPICQTGKYKNASTQIHKYRAYNEVTEKKNMWHIFETVVQ